MINLIETYNGVQLVLAIFAYLFAIIFALSLHEYAHAKVAFNQGDFTPKAQGRLTLNPFAHIDIMGFICLLVAGFGWAKPVQVNPVSFKEYRKGFFNVSIAGVVTNFVLGFFSCGIIILLAKIFTTDYINLFLLGQSVLTFGQGVFFLFHEFFLYFVVINIGLFLFNLLPIYPLDGFNLIQSFTKADNKFVNFMLRYGSIMLLAFVFIEYLADFSIIGTAMSYIVDSLSLFWTKLLI